MHKGEGAARESRTFYRTVKHILPIREDFLSDKDIGKTIPRRLEFVRLWEGLSVFETLDQARQKAIAFPAQGAFIAALAIPNAGRITYERTGRTEGHYTLWGDADDLLKCVTSVQPVHVREKG